eukprot:7576537-Heterocapsa_arctica.AAC.1
MDKGGAPCFPTFATAVSWVSEVEMREAVSRNDRKTNIEEPSGPPVIIFTANNRKESSDRLIQATSEHWRKAARESKYEA